MTFSQLSPREVVRALQTLNDDKTKQLFYQLDLPIQTLTNIEAKHSGGMLTIHCVHKWINGDPEASWGKIVTGLRHIGMKVLAKELATQYHIETPPSVNDHLTSDPIIPRPPVSAQDSDGTQSSVTSGSKPLQPLTSEVSSDHPATESAISNPVQSVALKDISTQAVTSGTESAPGNHVISTAYPAAVTPVVHISSTHTDTGTTEPTPNISLQPFAPLDFTAHSAPVITDRVKQVKEEIRQLQNTFINIVSKTR